MNEEILSAVNGEVFGVWFLIGAALVFWMQAGFAMVETGFTRAKNAGNILMKNLMDFCIGTVVFILIGFGLLFGEDLVGLIGKPGFDIFTNYAEFDWSNFVFNLVFCATTATIVSGAMAERTKFLSYCIYSGIISALIYPIEAHWIWGGGWLAQMGFHDFAGSCAIHMVGGISALIGAKILGPRIGKFTKDKNGKVSKVNAFPGHNLPMGCLGVFILWLGWYGFNGAACTSVEQLGSVFVTTTIAPAIATVVCMIFTWMKYGKPDVSMCLNASLAGLVGITAGCANVDAVGAAVIGVVDGLLVIFGVWFVDNICRVDDPVGAVAVHGFNGAWGALAVGLFDYENGLFYGGGFHQFGVQLLGVVSIGLYAAVIMAIVFIVINKVFGLRVTAEEEILGLDATEHGLPSAYADFMPAGDRFYAASTGIGKIGELMGSVPPEHAVPVTEVTPAAKAPLPGTDATAAGGKASAEGVEGVKISRISIVCKQNKFEDLQAALNEIGVKGITVTQVLGCGTQKGNAEYYRGVPMDFTLLPKIKVEVIVSAVPVDKVIEAAKEALYTGHIGDGKIFVYDVEDVIKVRTGERGFDALQDDE